MSVARRVGKLCRFLQANRKFTKARSCDKHSYLNAKGTSSWSLKLPSLPSGRYTIWSRGIDAAGNIERKARGRNSDRGADPRALNAYQDCSGTSPR